MRTGADQSDWGQFTLILGLAEDLLPVVCNPDAKISPTSALKSLGKIPSHYAADGTVIGIRRWTEYRASPADIAKWSANPDYGICLQTRNVRALDCDITDENLAAEVFAWLMSNLPVELPVRGRANSPKFLMPFRLPGEHGKRILRLPDNKGNIEFLANGQQFIAAGTHSSGVRYAWRNGLPNDIPTLTIDQFETLWANLKAKFGAEEAKEDFSARKPAGGDIDDAQILDFLEQSGVVLGYSSEGSAYITCPFKAGHSSEGDKTETIYFPKGLRGYQSGHVKCLHASCAGYSDDDFLRGLGYWDSKFEDLGPEPTIDPTVIPPDLQKLADRFRCINADEYVQRTRPGWIIKNLLPRAQLGVLFGEPGAGKSFVAIDIAMSIARGIEWNGLKTNQGPVVYVCAENQGGMINHLAAYAQNKGIALKNIPFKIMDSVPDIMDPKNVQAIELAVSTSGGASLIFIDTFARTTHGANENSGEDMGLAIEHCLYIAKKTNSLVVLVHHTGKDLTKGARGHSSIKAAADVEIFISREGSVRKMKVTKQKNGPDGKEWGFDLTIENIGMDEDGDIETSCAVTYVPVQKKIASRKALGELEQGVVDAFDQDEGSPVAHKIINERVRTAFIYKRDGKGPRIDNIDRAVEGVVKKGFLKLEAGFLVSGI